jgi:hypothetical protein
MAGLGAYEVIGWRTSRRGAGGKSGEQRQAKTWVVGCYCSEALSLGTGVRSKRHGRHEVVRVTDGRYGFQSLFVLGKEMAQVRVAL